MLRLYPQIIRLLEDRGAQTCAELADACDTIREDVYRALVRLHGMAVVHRVKVSGRVMWWVPEGGDV